MSDSELCISCGQPHQYYRKHDPDCCESERLLLAEFKVIDDRYEKSKTDLLQTLRSVKKTFWKEPKLKMEIDDAIQSLE